MMRVIQISQTCCSRTIGRTAFVLGLFDRSTPLVFCEALWCSGYSTLAFGSVRHGFESEHRLFSHHSASISLQQAEITDEVLTGLFSSSTAVVHSASYSPGRANRVAAYHGGSAAGFTQRSRKSFAYLYSSFPIR